MPATCPDCGGPTRQAFPTTDAYVACRRCGHVHPAQPLPTLADRLDRATELDGPGALVSHAEVLDTWESTPGIRPAEVATALGVSTKTVRRHLDDLRQAGLTR